MHAQAEPTAGTLGRNPAPFTPAGQPQCPDQFWTSTGPAQGHAGDSYAPALVQGLSVRSFTPLNFWPNSKQEARAARQASCWVEKVVKGAWVFTIFMLKSELEMFEWLGSTISSIPVRQGRLL